MTSELIERALAGEATFNEDLHLVMERNGYPEDTWYSFSYSPVRGEDGQISGMFCACTETTQKVLAERRVEGERNRLAQMFEQAPGFMAILTGQDHVFEFANQAYLRLVGQRKLIGLPVRDAFPEIAEHGFYETLDLVYRTGERFVAEQMPVRLRAPSEKTAREHLLDFIYEPIVDEAGTVTGIFVEGYDATERARAVAALKESEARLRDSEERYRSALRIGRIGSWETDLIGKVRYWSQEGLALFGLDLPDGRGRVGGADDEWRNALHPDDRHVPDEAYRLADAQDLFQVEYRIVRPDGAIVWFAGHGYVASRGPDGRPARLVNVAADITERKRAEEHQTLLINELNHRVKNTLATVQSIAAQTLRSASTMEQAKDAFESRLLALSRVHDVLTQENWEGASLYDVVAKAVEPYSSRAEDRLHFAGPAVRLSPREALAFSMAFQELATNAVKYDALSADSGEIRISWSMDPARERLLTLNWRECGGPPVAKPHRRGFGTRLIERSLAEDLDGAVKMAFEPDGLVCTVEARLG